MNRVTQRQRGGVTRANGGQSIKGGTQIQNLSAAHVFRDAAKKCRFTHLTGVIFLLWRVGFLACAHCNLILHN